MKSLTKIAMTLACMAATSGYAGGSSSVGTGYKGSATATVVDDAVQLTVTGDAAKTIWDQLNVAVTGPFSTGLCHQGQPCDPPTFWGKKGNGVACSMITHSVSGIVDYSCNFKVSVDGDVTAD